ncbi:MAG: Na+/H+ antiporter subunit E [Clostridia bacterium]|nr:Na+/H+ antiporter subunit E [Clostridia bacterium]
MFFVLFAVWILLNGQWTTEIAVTGAVLSGLLYLFMWKFMGYSPKRDWQFARRIPGFFRYLVYLVGEITRSAGATIRLIWAFDREIEPQLVSFKTKLKTDMGKTVLANSITLTPGTITVDVHEDLFLVHALDTEFSEGIEDSEMQQRIMAVEGGKKA